MVRFRQAQHSAKLCTEVLATQRKNITAQLNMSYPRKRESPTQTRKTKNEMPVQVGHDRAYMISFREEPTPNPSLW